MNIIDELTWRDAINQQTNEERLRGSLKKKSISLYCGVDQLVIRCISDI